MNARSDLLQHLRRLDELHKARAAFKARSPKVAPQRAEIDAIRLLLLPSAILKHYDHCRARNRPVVVPVRQGICGGCHPAMTRSSRAALNRSGETLNVCENCGVLIYLAEDVLSASAIQVGR